MFVLCVECSRISAHVTATSTPPDCKKDMKSDPFNYWLKWETDFPNLAPVNITNKSEGCCKGRCHLHPRLHYKFTYVLLNNARWQNFHRINFHCSSTNHEIYIPWKFWVYRMYSSISTIAHSRHSMHASFYSISTLMARYLRPRVHNFRGRGECPTSHIARTNTLR